MLFRVRDETAPWTGLGGAAGLVMSGNLLAVAASQANAVTVILPLDPNTPFRHAVFRDGEGGFDYPAGAADVAWSGNLLAIAASEDHAVTLGTVSIVSPPQIRAVLRNGVGGFSFLAGARAVAFSGNLLAVAAQTDNAITLVDVTNPASPVLRGVARSGVDGMPELRGPCALAFSGNWLAVAARGNDRIALLEVSDPTRPQCRGWVTDGVGGVGFLNSPLGVALAGTTLAATGSADSGLAMFSIAPQTAGLTADGWVGLDTRQPQARLHVMGDLRVEGDRASLHTSRFEAGRHARAAGEYSQALGRYSAAEGRGTLALGSQPWAYHDGSFVWADRTSSMIASSSEANQFTARASGGVRFFSNASQTTGSRLAPGGNSWNSVSDRAVKENFRAADPQAVLDKLASLPITEGNLVSQDPAIRHLGPMAQDFHAAFGLGEDDRHISSSDADGVPDLVMEVVSEGSWQRDRIQKRALYEQFGLPEYWIVDPESRTIEVFALKKGGYALHSKGTGKETVCSSLLAGFGVSFHDLQESERQ